jgi:hypothetical protein
MQTGLDLSRWRAEPRGVGYRRWSIIAAGLQLLLRTRFHRILVVVAWSAGLVIAAAGFVFSQIVSNTGTMMSLAQHLGPRFEAAATVLTGLVALYPDICVGGIFTLILWVHSFLGLWLSLFALTATVPRLITRDRASNALTIYLSRPLTTTDYLLGKLGMIVGIILLVWTGPLLFGWVVSMLFAINFDFVRYSLEPLGRALLFNGIALVALAAIALGVSALSKTSRNVIAIWVGLWIVLGTLASPPPAPRWIKHASFTHDLGEVRQEVLRLDRVLTGAAEQLPLIDQHLVDSLKRSGEKAQASDFSGSLAALGVFVVLTSGLFFRKLRPE